MINVTCDNKIDNEECRSKQSMSNAYIIPDDWVQIQILVVNGGQVAKFFCPKCAVKSYVDKKSLLHIKQLNIKDNLESILTNFIEEKVEDYLENAQ